MAHTSIASRRVGADHPIAKRIRALYWKRRMLEAHEMVSFTPTRRSCL